MVASAAAIAGAGATSAGSAGLWSGAGSAAISGGLGLLGSAMGANSAAKAAGTSWKQQILMAMFQRDWERKKMQNAYQWTVDDMHKAGLNPILALGRQNQGGGISAGAGDTSGLQSAGQIMAQGLQNIIPVATNVYSALKGTENQTTQTEADITLKQAEATKIIAETQNLPQKMKSEILKNIADAGKTKQETRIEKQKGNAAENAGNILKTLTQKVENTVDGIYQSYRHHKRMNTINNSWSARQASLRE